MQYRDLRDWIERVRDLGELRDVRGATWEEDIGRVTEMLHHTDDSPAVLFDDIPGYPSGFRILANANATRKRLALTLGLPIDIERRPLMARFLELTEQGRAIVPGVVKDGRVMETVLRADAVDGDDPLIFIASTLEVPRGISEYDWAGGIRGEPYEVITEPITGLPMPASAEIVLAGFLHHDKRLPEGPFGEWTGYYASGERAEPVLEVEAIYHRDDPIILGVPPNKPPYEPHRYREYLRSALLLRELKAAGVPGVVDAHCFGVGGCRLLNAVSIEQRYAGHSRQAGHVAAMCRVGAYLGRIVIVVDKDIDVTDINDVMWAVVTRSDPERSLDIINRAWSGPLDPAIAPDIKGHNSRMIIDATRPWEWRDKFPIAIGPDAQTKRETRKKWGHLLAPEPARERGARDRKSTRLNS